CDHRYLHSFPTRRSSDLIKLVGLKMTISAWSRGRIFSRRRAQVRPPKPPPTTTTRARSAITGLRRFSFLSELWCLTLTATYANRSEEHTSELQSRSDLVC